jgi:L-asparaginase
VPDTTDTADEKMKLIYVVTTGGTIEKAYSEQNGTVANLDSKIDRYLRLLRLPDSDIHIVPLMNIDSLEMMDSDRAMILGTVKALLQQAAPVVISHGTDTMVETGLYLQHALPEVKSPIVLTGAMTPLGFEGSDGLQNLTESLFAARILPPGVHVVIHNQVFLVDRVKKDKTLARFVSADQEPTVEHKGNQRTEHI